MQAMAVARLTPEGAQRPLSMGNAVQIPPGSPGAIPGDGQGPYLSPGKSLYVIFIYLLQSPSWVNLFCVIYFKQFWERVSFPHVVLL